MPRLDNEWSQCKPLHGAAAAWSTQTDSTAGITQQRGHKCRTTACTCYPPSEARNNLNPKYDEWHMRRGRANQCTRRRRLYHFIIVLYNFISFYSFHSFTHFTHLHSVRTDSTAAMQQRGQVPVVTQTCYPHTEARNNLLSNPGPDCKQIF